MIVYYERLEVNFLILLSTFEMIHSAGETRTHKFHTVQDNIVLLTILLLLSLSVISDFVTIFGFNFNSNCKILDLCLTYCLLADNLPYLAWGFVVLVCF